MEFRRDWRLPVVACGVGVALFTAGAFSRLTNPPSPLILSASLAGLGVWGLQLYFVSGVRDREERILPFLDEFECQRLRRQRPFSIALVFILISLVGIPFALSFFAPLIKPIIYNGVIGACMVGLVVCCVAGAFGHAARHKILDEHERKAADAGPEFR